MCDAHEGDGGDVEWFPGDGVERGWGTEKVGGRRVGLPPEDFDVVGCGSGGVEERGDEGREGELGGDDAGLVVGAHEDGEGEVEDCPSGPEEGGERF